MRRIFNGFQILILVSALVDLSFSQSTDKSRVDKRLRTLEQAVEKLSERQRGLEARIAVLEKLNLTPSPEVLRQAYVTSNKDAIINHMNNLAATAYQYRIRPTTMGGGGGDSYEGFKIPKSMMSTDFATFSATATRD